MLHGTKQSKVEGWVVQVAATQGKDSDLLQYVFTVGLKIKFWDNRIMIVSTSLKSEAVRTTQKILKAHVTTNIEQLAQPRHAIITWSVQNWKWLNYCLFHVYTYAC